jgi:hypothetical protein
MPFQRIYHTTIVIKDFKHISTSENSVIQTLFSSDALAIIGDPMIQRFFSSHLSYSLHVKRKSRYTSTNFKTYKNLNFTHHQRNSSEVSNGAGKMGTEKTIPSIPPCH